MDPITNPFTPGAGQRPTELAGRDTILSAANVLLKRVLAGKAQRSMMLYGLRGVGKTVLLNRIEEMATADGYIISHLEMTEKDDFKKVIGLHFKKILLKISTVEKAKSFLKKAFGVLNAFSFTIKDGPEIKIDAETIVGEADSGIFESDFVDLCVCLGQAAKQEEKFLLITIDETQYIDEAAFSALIAANNRVTQLELPFVFICAGLPNILALAAEAKSFAERLFEFIKVDRLTYDATKLALIYPAHNSHVEFEESALQAIYEFTQGYPYFIQELGKHTWDIATKSPITIEDVKAGKQITLDKLDESFFKVRFDRATGAEKKLMFAMAGMGDGPYNTGDVAKKMGIGVKSMGPYRASVIGKGYVYQPSHGLIDFSVPMFADFLRRVKKGEVIKLPFNLLML